MSKDNNKLSIQIIIFIVIFAIAFLGTKYVMSSLTSTENILEEVSKEMNVKCPMMLNPDIRLEYTDVMAVQGKYGLLYVCTLINEDVSDKKFDPELVGKKTKLAAQKDFESNPEMKKARKRDVTIYYVCYDKNKKNLVGFEITGQKNNTNK